MFLNLMPPIKINGELRYIYIPLAIPESNCEILEKLYNINGIIRYNHIKDVAFINMDIPEMAELKNEFLKIWPKARCSCCENGEHIEKKH